MLSGTDKESRRTEGELRVANGECRSRCGRVRAIGASPISSPKLRASGMAACVVALYVAAAVAAVQHFVAVWQCQRSAQILTEQFRIGEQQNKAVTNHHVASCVLHGADKLSLSHSLTHTRTQMIIISNDISANKGHLNTVPAGIIRVEGFDSIRNCIRQAAKCSTPRHQSCHKNKNKNNHSPARTTDRTTTTTIGKPGRKPFALPETTSRTFIYSPGNGMWQRGMR